MGIVLFCWEFFSIHAAQYYCCCLAPATKPCCCLASIILTTGSNTRSGFHTCDSLSWTALRRVDWADQIVHSCVLAAALSCSQAQCDRNWIKTNTTGGRESCPSLPKPACSHADLWLQALRPFAEKAARTLVLRLGYPRRLPVEAIFCS